MITRRRLLIAGAIAALAALVVLTPRTEDPDATQALRRYLANLGVPVTEADGLPPAEGTLVLLADVRAPAEAQPILDWVQGGGHLVVTDPDSAIVSMAGGSPTATIGFTGTEELEPDCLAPAVVGIDRIVARASDRVLVSEDPAMVSCFPVGDGALLLTRSFGDGRITLVGGQSAFTNAMLREADNAVLAAQVAGPGRDVVFGPPAVGAPAPLGIWDALPDGARASLVAIVAAVLAFALVRARRLGRPIVEEPIAPIPGSELVRAAGRMYRQARAAAYAGGLMRRGAVSRLSRRLGAAGPDDLAAATARATDLSPERVGEILAGREPRDDIELMELGAELEGLTARAEMGSR
jgi:Domain of unknown function (DUF4350)